MYCSKNYYNYDRYSHYISVSSHLVFDLYYLLQG